MKFGLAGLGVLALSYALTINVPVADLEYEIVNDGVFDRIIVHSANLVDGVPGTPELPLITYNYLLPRGQIAGNIEIISSSWEELPIPCHLYPVQRPASIETVLVFTEPDLIAYGSAAFLPESPLMSYRCGNLRGYRLLQIQLSPFRYIAADKKLWVLKSLALKVETVGNIPGFAPYRTTSLGFKTIVNCLSQIIVNKDALNNHAYVPATIIQENEPDSLPSDLPSLIGPPVDLLIITDDVQLNAYEDFAEFKKSLGYNTAVKTVNWINQHYHGRDDAERMRNFIREAYQLWGVSYVLLAGDPPLVPTAYVWVDRTVIYAGLWLPIACDLYFSDLDGSWNFDGDDRLGEVEDSVDLYPDVFVGRLPTRNGNDVEQYLHKQKKYLNPGTASYQTRALAFSSFLDQNWPGLPWAQHVMNRLPSYFTKSYLAEFLGNLDVQALYDSISSGFNFVVGVGHGDVNNMVIHYRPPRKFITNFFYDSLSNDPLYAGLLTVVTCYTNPFHGDCLGEHWVMNPTGGGLAYHGPTSSSEGNIHKEYVANLVNHIFSMPLAKANAFSKIPFIPSAHNNNWVRVHQFSLSLLGDPTLTLWKEHPHTYQTVSIEPYPLRVGIDTVEVRVDIAVDPLDFTVVFYRPGEVFVRDSTAVGHLTRVLETRTDGYLFCTVITEGYVMYRDSVPVYGADGYAYYRGYAVIDSLGNNNGMINPGEEIGLRIEIGNGGGAVSTGVWARMTSYDSMVVVLADSVWYGDIDAGATVLGMPFGLSVGHGVRDGTWLLFSLEMHGCFGTVLDSFQAPCYGSQVSHFGQVHVGWDTVWVLPKAVNVGRDLSDSVFGYVVGVGDSVVVLDSVVNFGPVGIGEVVNARDSLCFVGGGAASYDYELRTGTGLISSYRVVLGDVGRVERLRVSGGDGLISLRWGALSGALGYRVYRGVNGGYELKNLDLVSGCYYEDLAVVPGIEYRYYVTAVDSGYNIGLSSDTVPGRLNPLPAPGWPQVVYSYIFSSPNFGDIDPSYPGLEIAVCGWDGCVYAWHHDGTKLGNNDGRIFYSGTDRCWGSPAIGDINNDGHLEIVCGGGKESNQLFVFDRHGQHLPPFPVNIGANLSSSCVLGNITGDSRLEICVYAGAPANFLYVVNHQGIIEWQYPLLADFHGMAPALADINDDGLAEVFFGFNNGLDAGLIGFSNSGAVLPGFPALGHDAASPIIADLNGDGVIDIAVGTTEWKLQAYDRYGRFVPGFPIMLGNSIKGTPAVFDLDGDGQLELMISGYDFSFHVYKLSSSHYEWPCYQYDPHNSGWYRSGFFPVNDGLKHGRSITPWLAVWPTPFRKSVRINFNIPPGSIQSSIHVYDVTGRLIRDLTSESSAKPGNGSITWRGEDDCGRMAANGVYFVRLRSDAFSKTCKIIKIH